MTQKSFCMFTGVIFLIIAVLHLLRVLNGWPAMIGATVIPIWVSWLALILGGLLSWQGFKNSK